MDAYTVTRLYHTALLQWFESTHFQSELDLCPFSDLTSPLSSLFIPVFKNHPFQNILLLASDGRVCSVKSMEEPAPDTFRIRRYMKIDNRSSISSISSVITFLYQLLSIDSESKHISVLDLIGLLKFVQNFILENEAESVEWMRFVRHHLFGAPPFLRDRTSLWKPLRDKVISDMMERDASSESILHYEQTLSKFNTCYKMIEQLQGQITFQQERISFLEQVLMDSNVITPSSVEDPPSPLFAPNGGSIVASTS